MDEPFAALDEITRWRLNEDLRAVVAELGASVVFVTHSIYESVFLADRIAVVTPRPGRIAATLDMRADVARDAAYRTSAAYAARCREALAALEAGMAQPA